MVHTFSNMLSAALCGKKKKKKYPFKMEDWFRIEYGKDWKHALRYYDETGSIHWKGW